MYNRSNLVMRINRFLINERLSSKDAPLDILVHCRRMHNGKPPATIGSISSSNPGLESIKQEGLHILTSLTRDVQSKTKRRLLLKDEDSGPTPIQLKEATRLKYLVEEALISYTSKKGGISPFCIMGEPIAIIDVEITQDLRNARVYWTLPYGVLLMNAFNREMREQSVKRMQHVLDEKGGVIQGIVSTKMRHYFRPPKLKFVPAEGEMLRNTLQDIMM